MLIIPTKLKEIMMKYNGCIKILRKFILSNFNHQ